MRPTIRGLLFDKDGTLVDTFAGWIAHNRRLHRELQALYGGAADQDAVDAALGIRNGAPVPGGLLACGTEDQILWAHRPLLFRPPAAEAFLSEVRDLNRRLFRQSPPTPVPLGDPKPVLARLRSAGFRLGLATSDNFENALRDLSSLGGEFLEFWATADRLDRPKPDPESVWQFCAFTGLTPAEVAFVGDGPTDLGAARAAGCGLFAALRSPTCPSEVLAAADVVLERLDELPDVLEARGTTGSASPRSR